MLIWWSDHWKRAKQKLLPKWSLLPWSAHQAPTRHRQLPETYCHCHSPLPVIELRGTAKFPSTATEHSLNFGQCLVITAQHCPFTWCFQYWSYLLLLRPECISIHPIYFNQKHLQLWVLCVLPTQCKPFRIPTRQHNWTNKQGLAAISSRASGHKSKMKLMLKLTAFLH